MKINTMVAQISWYLKYNTLSLAKQPKLTSNGTIKNKPYEKKPTRN